MSTPDPAHYIPLQDIALWQGNYNDGDVGRIAQSIEAFGFNQAVRLWHGECRAGNHSVKALRWRQQQGESVPKGEGCIEHDGDWYVKFVNVDHLNEAEALAFAIADNRLAALASHDEGLLTDYLNRLAQTDAGVFLATGYDDDDLNKRLLEYERDQGVPFYDVTDLPDAAQGGAVRVTYIIYVTFPDEDQFYEGMRLLSYGKRNERREGSTMGSLDGSEWLERWREDLTDGT